MKLNKLGSISQDTFKESMSHERVFQVSTLTTVYRRILKTCSNLIYSTNWKSLKPRLGL
eukprot:UN17973